MVEALTEPINPNIISRMGRKKKKYSAPAGLVRHPGSENWYIKWRKIYKSTGTPDLEKARMIFIEVQRMILTEESRAREIVGHSIPFSKMMQRYLKEITPAKRSARADHTNSAQPLRFFKDRLKDPPIDTITIQDIYKYMDWRKDQRPAAAKEDTQRKISGSTINREISLMSDGFRKAIRWGELQVNPCIGIERFSEASRERYITDRELAAIFKIAQLKEESKHLADIVTALYYTGQRLGRILGLKWNQVNFDERSITFPQTSKNKKVPDKIWIVDPLFALFHTIRAKRTLYKVVGPYVFQKANGKPYRSIKTSWKSSCRAAGIENARIHDIRHKSITDMLEAGIPVVKVKTAVGHSQTSTTDGYSHLQVNATREALESLAKQRFL